MIEFFLSPEVVVFTGVLVVVTLFAVFELVLSALAGAGFSDLVETLVDTHSLPDTSFTNWLFIREVPLMISIMTACTGFAATGMALHGLSLQLDALRLPAAMAYPLAGLGALGAMNMVGRFFKRFKFTHTTALGEHEFVGRKAILLSDDASEESPGQAKFTDQHGQDHYVMVRPAVGKTLVRGDGVLLVRSEGAFWDVDLVEPIARD